MPTTKNITISITKELHEKMQKYRWINWSGFCKRTISMMIKTLEENDPMEKMQQVVEIEKP